MTTTYKGFYTDSLGTCEIAVENDFSILTMVIDGVLFSGGLDDLSIEDKSKYTAAQLERFTFLRTPVYQSDRFVESLCNCSIEMVVPQVIIDKRKGIQFYANLTIACALGKPRPEAGRGIEFEKITLTLAIAGKTYTGISGDVEGALDGIRKQIDDTYKFRNCYGCQFGDYSVYGQSSFGSMQCYKNQKEAYNKVTSKAEYLQLDAPERHIQETYRCDEFEIRKNGAGYRG